MEAGKLFMMSTITRFRKLATIGAIAAALSVLAATEVRAQGFFSPFIGYDFGGDSGCQTLRGCEEKKLNAGVSFGSLGRAGGFEQEFAYAKNFFGSVPGQGSSVLTLMSNVMIAPKIGPVRPYGVFGVGLMKSKVELTAGDVLSFSNNNFAWDLGGGLMIFFGEHFGIRGEVRHFQSFQDIQVAGFAIDNTKLDFNRASIGLVLK
jgi:opacity protein-like surface antigen